MDYRGKSQYFIALKASAELEAEGDALFERHRQFMERTHHREGDLALLQYTVTKRVNDDGSISYLVYEVYETVGGVVEHGRLAQEEGIVEAFYGFVGKCDVIGGDGPASIVHSLW